MQAGEAPRPAVTLEEAARQLVLDEILRGNLAPKSKLKIRELSARYGIGASPLREALSRLVPAGLVTLESNKGFRVASLSLRELIEITEMREVVEAAAFCRAIERGDDTWEAEIVSSFHMLSRVISRYASESDKTRPEWEQYHHAFHRQLISACGNSRLLQTVDALHQHLVRYRTILLMTEMSPQRLLHIHEELMRVALDRDLDNASAIMRRHVKFNVDLVREGIRADPALREVIEDL